MCKATEAYKEMDAKEREEEQKLEVILWCEKGIAWRVYLIHLASIFVLFRCRTGKSVRPRNN
jgi:hypothetical protein